MLMKRRYDNKKIDRRRLKGKPRKAGISSLEMIAVFMMFMLMLGFFFDTFTLLNQHYVASREANIVTRQIAIQGGVGTRQPFSHVRYGQSYETSLSIHRRVRNRMRGVGVDDYSIYLNPNEEGVHTGWIEIRPSSTIPIPYQENFEFLLEYEYEWQMMGQMIPGMGGTRTRRIQRSAVSEIGG